MTQDGWRPVTRKINHVMRVGALKSLTCRDGRGGAGDGAQSGTNDLINHAYRKEPPKKTSGYQSSVEFPV